tara:strand:+ start:224 stop:598 length:375 start_codon:yes stop_codon:yes gene_type:complete
VKKSELRQIIKEEITTTLSENVPSIPQLKSIAKEEVGEFIDGLFQKYPNILNPTTPKDKRKVQDHFANVINDEIVRRIVAPINSSSVERYRTPGEIEKSDRESAEYYSTHDKYGNTNYDSRYAK